MLQQSTLVYKSNSCCPHKSTLLEINVKDIIELLNVHVWFLKKVFLTNHNMGLINKLNK